MTINIFEQCWTTMWIETNMLTTTPRSHPSRTDGGREFHNDGVPYAPQYLRPLNRIADQPGRRSLHSAGTSRLIVPPVRLSSTVPSQLWPHVRGTTCLQMSRLLSRCPHSASDWRPVCFQSHFPDISWIFNSPSWTLTDLLQWTSQGFYYLCQYKKPKLFDLLKSSQDRQVVKWAKWVTYDHQWEYCWERSETTHREPTMDKHDVE